MNCEVSEFPRKSDRIEKVHDFYQKMIIYHVDRQNNCAILKTGRPPLHDLLAQRR